MLRRCVCRVLNNCEMFSKKNSSLLAARTPLEIPRRTIMDNEKRISLENPLKDYKKLMENLLDAKLDDDQQKELYNVIAAETRNVVWKLVFDEPQPPTDDRMKKAGELLKEHKADAGFFVPWDYNDWVIGLRDELLKRKLFDFWHNVIVKEELGSCCARDSDYFDDLDDPEPADFYRHAGAAPAWESKTTAQTPNAVATDNSNSNIPITPAVASAASTVTSSSAVDKDYKISLENPVESYKKLIQVNLTENAACNDDQIEVIFGAIAESVRKTAWSLLFDEPQPPTVERQTKAGDLLKEHKMDAGFYEPWAYNDWVVKVKEEVLKRQLFDFWRNQMVKRELGLCWARDCDYFDDMEDPEPAKFYKEAGCTAPWLKEEEQNRENEHRSGDAK